MQIFDFKSGTLHVCTALQLAGYVLLASEGIDAEGKKFIDRPDKGAFEIKLYHPIYKFAGTIDMVIDDKKETIKAFALYLKDNGTYQLEDHTKDYRKNKQIFLSFLISYQWRQEKGLL